MQHICILSTKGDESFPWIKLTVTSFLSIRFSYTSVPLLSSTNFDGMLQVDYFVLNVGFETMIVETCLMVKGLINVLQGFDASNSPKLEALEDFTSVENGELHELV